MKILIVEDSKSDRLVTAQRLERFGATVISADGGYTAVDLFRQERPDLVLLDVVLPDIDGFEVARRIRESEQSGGWTPIIFLSAKTSDADLEKGIAVGGDDYLFKPISEVVLAAKIRAMQRIVQMRTSLVALTRQLDAANQELKRLSASDGLTGLPNRRHFDEALEREWRRARRDHAEITMMMCDVDHFKAYNDTYGHQAGDDCLKQVATAIRRALERGADTAARYGGEEFAVILPGTGLQGALLVAHRMLQAIRQLDLPNGSSSSGKLTASIGLACTIPAEDSPHTLIEAADQALYRAKRDGRNRVCHSIAVSPPRSASQ